MSVQPYDFYYQIILLGKKNPTYPTLVDEMTAIATALQADATTHDLTIQLPPAAVRPSAAQTPFTNQALLLVNRGKGGNLANVTMAAAITNAFPPPPLVEQERRP
jgi:hypothetical protein